MYDVEAEWIFEKAIRMYSIFHGGRILIGISVLSSMHLISQNSASPWQLESVHSVERFIRAVKYGDGRIFQESERLYKALKSLRAHFQHKTQKQSQTGESNHHMGQVRRGGLLSPILHQFRVDGTTVYGHADLIREKYGNFPKIYLNGSFAKLQKISIHNGISENMDEARFRAVLKDFHGFWCTPNSA